MQEDQNNGIDDWADAEASYLRDQGADPEKFNVIKTGEVVDQAPKKEEKEENPKPSSEEEVEPTEETSGSSVGDEQNKPEDEPVEPQQGEEEPVKAEEPTTTPSAYRELQRIRAEEGTLKSELKETLFPDFKAELVDASGDPINNVEDLMKLENPVTKQPFTREEATDYLVRARSYLDSEASKIEREVEQIASRHMTFREEAARVRQVWGNYLDKDPEMRKALWDAFEATMIKDPKTGTIIDIPVSVEAFYGGAMRPYEKAEAERMDAEKKRQEIADKMQKKQQEKIADRADVVSSSKKDPIDPEDQEWDKVVKKYYGENK